ncbi:hypothetical protein BDD12DRAFT_878630 [Trichophaea hybrida]|nr:hypothetical protein BDD12DRAFT_878630 [Trichophaea hybrida]
MAPKTRDSELDLKELQENLFQIDLTSTYHSRSDSTLAGPIFPSRFPTELQLVVFENCNLSSAFALSHTCGNLRRTFQTFKQTIVGSILGEPGCKEEADRLQQALLSAGSTDDTYVFPAMTIERMIPPLLKAICPGGYHHHGLCIRCWGLPEQHGLRRLLYNGWTEAVKNGGWPRKMPFRDLAEFVQKALPSSVSHGFLQIYPSPRPASAAIKIPTAPSRPSDTAASRVSSGVGPSNTTGRSGNRAGRHRNRTSAPLSGPPNNTSFPMRHPAETRNHATAPTSPHSRRRNSSAASANAPIGPPNSTNSHASPPTRRQNNNDTYGQTMRQTRPPTCSRTIVNRAARHLNSTSATASSPTESSSTAVAQTLSNNTTPTIPLAARTNWHYTDVWSTRHSATTASPTTQPPVVPLPTNTHSPALRRRPAFTLLPNPRYPATRTLPPRRPAINPPAATSTASPPITSFGRTRRPSTYAGATLDGTSYPYNHFFPPWHPAATSFINHARPSIYAVAAQGSVESAAPAAPTTSAVSVPIPRRHVRPPRQAAATANTANSVPATVLNTIRLALVYSCLHIPYSPTSECPEPILAAWDALTMAVFDRAGIEQNDSTLRILEKLRNRRLSGWSNLRCYHTEMKWKDEIMMRVGVLTRRAVEM